MAFAYDDFDDENIPRNTCPKCNCEYDGNHCPDCGLKFRPRCPDCGSRMAWSKPLSPCMNCGFPATERVFFVELPNEKLQT